MKEDSASRPGTNGQLFGALHASPDQLREVSRYAAGLRLSVALADAAPLAGTGFTRHGEIHVALRGSPRWTGMGEASGAAVDAAVAAAYRSRGTALLGDLHGSFALALYDARERRLVLAVDRVGIERIAWRATPDGVVFGSRADHVAHAPGPAARLRPQALFDFLMMHMVPSPDSVYEGVQKLRAATCVVFDGTKVETQRYWHPRFEATTSEGEAATAKRLLDTLEAAVATCAPGATSGAFLSGGLDSSTVGGMLAKVRGKGVATFSIGFGVEQYDELDYARIAVKHFGTQPHEYVVTPSDVVDAIPRIAGAYDEPFGNSSAVPTYFCAQLARSHGFDHLLAGDGGDELFGGNERYARQKVFEAYGSLPAWLRGGVVEPLSRLVDPEHPVTPLRKFRSYVDQASVGMPARLEHWNFMYRADLGEMLEPGLREAIEPRFALRRMQEVYDASQAPSLVDRMLWYDWQYTLADNDLRKVGTMCDLAGVRVSYPMLDDRLIDLSLQLSARQKVDGQNLRAFYKRALDGFLPREIIEKKKHGFGLPFGVWLKTHAPLAELIYDLLGALKSRGLVRPAFLDRLIAEHRTGHPSFYGYAIWDLAMLEAWLAAR